MASEGAQFANVLERIARDVIKQRDGLADRTLNQPVPLPEANTLYAIAPHLKQKCWAGRPLGSMLHDVHDLRVAHPDDLRVAAWAAAVHDVYQRAVAWKAAHPEDGALAWQQAETTFMRELQAISAPYTEAQMPQRVLSQRMDKHRHELFGFVREPEVPPDNNEAERVLRGCPLGRIVTSQNAAQGAPGGGTRSAVDSATKMTLASLFRTWRRMGINPFRACRALLLSLTLNRYQLPKCALAWQVRYNPRLGRGAAHAAKGGRQWG